MGLGLEVRTVFGRIAWVVSVRGFGVWGACKLRAWMTASAPVNLSKPWSNPLGKRTL